MSDKVLIVEDEDITGKFLKKALEDEKIDVEWMKNGKEAADKFKKGAYDLVVLDIILPGLKGDVVLERIREIDPYVVVVVYTNNINDHTMMSKFINLGVDAYINKGAGADLRKTVKIIKDKLEPFSLDEAHDLIDNINSNNNIEEE
ncbi:response regulator [Tumebacillus sp. ITR2]|uniref:Response regulator n=1 Tax=Tumebacillus amylolyticus TaxID=2801339 RepID=A0ABS1J9H5_9BACL|nr:response regulator [Tumebacillus amylolyticus]MBL0386865.1 response regulator [Tumebacillus amylolyticus]